MNNLTLIQRLLNRTMLKEENSSKLVNSLMLLENIVRQLKEIHKNLSIIQIELRHI